MSGKSIDDAAKERDAGTSPEKTSKSVTMPVADEVERTVVISTTSHMPPVSQSAKSGQVSSRNLSARFSLEVFRKKQRAGRDAGKEVEGEGTEK